MSSTTIRQSSALENRPTRLRAHPSGYVLRTGPYDEYDPGPWLWNAPADYRRDTRTGRHRRGEAPDPYVKLREDAWTRFLDVSEPLARANRLRAHRLSLTTDPRRRGVKAVLRRAVHAALTFLTRVPAL
ncbi:hypothetical protein K3N28_13480 [Glycomyces sp. TRM65418]|uniref:hypothetical protein n=1 Tax=Glycomyces sp. TRM65418 TaxID=2867006 RepID=UPI001CE55B2E|nr:hypothetical protein [Glycomyces sp. TRM65418]MCC3764077.1 hypothetical protein [Glycomyces sp. TRM65418]QZD53767.1 hypothetical protein K3N28_13415 [Glycomyces sp. TRM65418]